METIKKEEVRSLNPAHRGQTIGESSPEGPLCLSSFSIQDLMQLSKEDVLGLLHIELTPNRMKCALLSWEGLLKLMKSISPK